jgi:ribonuclease-3
MSFNENNILITRKELYDIWKKCGIKNRIKQKVGVPKVIQEAFIQNSYIIKDNNSDINSKCPGNVVPLQEKDNETLEWLGDGIIQATVTSYLYDRYPNQSQGFLSDTRSKIVRTSGLATFAKHLNFGKYIIMSSHVEKTSNGRENSKILEDAFEAFIGATFLYFKEIKNEDKAYAIIKLAMITLIESAIDISSVIKNDINYKTKLMKEFQKHFNKYPEYEEYKEEVDPDGKIVYHICIKTPDGEIIGKGFGKSNKKRAEQYSAKNALHNLKKINKQ